MPENSASDNKIPVIAPAELEKQEETASTSTKRKTVSAQEKTADGAASQPGTSVTPTPASTATVPAGSTTPAVANTEELAKKKAKEETEKKTKEEAEKKAKKEAEKEKAKAEKKVRRAEEKKARREEEAQQEQEHLTEQAKLYKQYDDQLNQQKKRRELVAELLNATSGNVPALFNEVNASLRGMMTADKGLTLDNQAKFTEANASFRIPSYTALTLDGSTNFFGMDVGKQELLYEQVGLFKGIVVDHGKETPVAQGYRDALKYKVQAGDNPATKPTRVFYKKPSLSGFFETTYALDETETKNQQTGIFNLGFGLSASYSTFFTSAAMRAGYSRNKEQQHEQTKYAKNVTITSSFFLPKVELSFDTLYPCASDDFTAAVEGVFQLPREMQFARLVEMLRHFGHFVATNLIVGGRLYSTDTKHLDSDSKLDNVLTKQAATFQASFSTLRFEGGMEGKMTHEESSKAAERNAHENQNLQLRAVGGEGAYVHSTEQWVKSLNEYTAWGLVRFDNLVPSIDTLPAALRQQCHALLEATINAPETSIEGLREQGADFLFYTGYHEKYGRRAQPRYFVLKGSGTDRKVLTVASGKKLNDSEVTLKLYEGAITQEWWYSPNGKIYARNDQAETDQYVLSVATLNGSSKLVITQEDYFENQYWELTLGQLKNKDLNKYLDFDGDTVVIGSDRPATNRRNVWQTLTGQQLNQIREVKPRQEIKPVSSPKVTMLKDGQYLDKSQRLVSARSMAELLFQGKKLVIQYDQKEIWSRSFEAVPEKLYLENGNLFVVDASGQSHYWFGKPDMLPLVGGDTLELLDNGNLELLSREGRTLWESASIVYSVLRRGDSESVLTVHHTDSEPDMQHTFVRLTTLPFVGADHQLWYLNRNRQLICKAQPNAQTKMALVCEDNAGLRVMAENYRNKDQQWTVDASTTGTIFNELRNKYLPYSDDGKILSASISSQYSWRLVAQFPYRSGTSHKLALKHPVRVNNEAREKGYMRLDKDVGYVHLDQFSLLDVSKVAPDKTKVVLDTQLGNSAGIVLRGLRLFEYGDNRLAVQAIIQNGQYVQSKVWDEGGHFASFDKKQFYFDKAPVYVPNDIEKLGLYKTKKGFALKASKGSTSYENYDEDQQLRLLHDESGKTKIEFYETTEVVADEDETVVGFGFTVTCGNRLSPYLLVVKQSESLAAV